MWNIFTFEERFGNTSSIFSKMETMNSNELQKARKKNTMSTLEYCKLLLDKISFNKELFNKEYQKGLKYLSSSEKAELKEWLLLKGKEIE